MSEQTKNINEKLTAKERKVLAEQGRLNPHEPMQTDYVSPGSDAHLALLGLERCEKTEEHPYEYRLSDPTMFGPNATEIFLKRVLESKIAQFESAPVSPQTKDRFEPGYAPEMWEPKE